MARAKITLTRNGEDLEGWLSSGITRSIEDISGTFDISLSLDKEEPLPIDRQDDVTININGHQVMAGYVLAADPFYSREDVGIRVQGRDYTGDLVISSAIHGGGQWLNSKIDAIAQDLCEPFGIDVIVDADVGQPLKRWELDPGETVAESLARAASYRGVLVTRNNAGQLLLTTAGKQKAVAAIVNGKNVISMEPAGTDADRHSEYIIQGQGEINNIGDAKRAGQLKGKAQDLHLKRYLPLIISADNSSEGLDLQEQAEHMARVRMAQAFRYTYTLEGWEANGQPWEINTLVPIYDDVLGLDGEEMLIVETNATISRDNADVTEVTVCPAEAYKKLALPEPKQSKSRKSGRKGKRKRDGLIHNWR